MSALDVAKRCEVPSQLMLSKAPGDLVVGDGPTEKRMDEADDLRSVLHDIMNLGSRHSGGLIQSRNRRWPPS